MYITFDEGIDETLQTVILEELLDKPDILKQLPAGEYFYEKEGVAVGYSWRKQKHHVHVKYCLPTK